MAGDGMPVLIWGDHLSFTLSPGGILLAALGSAGPDEYSTRCDDECVPLAHILSNHKPEPLPKKVAKKLRKIVERASTT